MVRGLKDVSRYPYLFAELLRRGYGDDDLLKIAGRNHLRAMRQMEKWPDRSSAAGQLVLNTTPPSSRSRHAR